MARVFITCNLPWDAPDILRAAGHEVIMRADATAAPADELLEGLRDADAALTMVVDRIDRTLLETCPRLRVVANVAVGYDNFALADLAAAGVWATNTPGVLAETTADLAWALLMAAARRVVESDRDTRAGGWRAWSPVSFLGADVNGGTIGIVGLGEIGLAMARRARGFGMRVLYTASTPKGAAEADLGVERMDLDGLLQRSDFVSLHVPLNAETRRLIGAPELARMKPGAILVNTARGGVIDQDALVDALRAGQIGGAALDVTEPEPLPANHALFSFPNVVITPHIASASTATRSRMARMAAENVIAVLAGREPSNPVVRPDRPRAG